MALISGFCKMIIIIQVFRVGHPAILYTRREHVTLLAEFLDLDTDFDDDPDLFLHCK